MRDVLMPPFSSSRISASAVERQDFGLRQPALQCRAPHRFEIEAAPVVAAFEGDAGPAPRHGDGDPAGLRLAGAAPFVRRLDAMRHGVAHDLDQRGLDRAQDMGIEPQIAALPLEHDLLRQRPCAVSRAILSSVANSDPTETRRRRSAVSRS